MATGRSTSLGALLRFEALRCIWRNTLDKSLPNRAATSVGFFALVLETGQAAKFRRREVLEGASAPKHRGLARASPKQARRARTTGAPAQTALSHGERDHSAMTKLRMSMTVKAQMSN